MTGGQGRLRKEGQGYEITVSRSRRPTQWAQADPLASNHDVSGCHAWADGLYRRSPGLGWLTTSDDQGAGLAMAQGANTLEACQTAFDAEVAAIRTVLEWFN